MLLIKELDRTIRDLFNYGIERIELKAKRILTGRPLIDSHW